MDSFPPIIIKGFIIHPYQIIAWSPFLSIIPLFLSELMMTRNAIKAMESVWVVGYRFLSVDVEGIRR